MKKHTLYMAGTSPALAFGLPLLEKEFEIAQAPGSHVTHLLLPVPSFEADGTIKGGGAPEDILSRLPRDTVVIGGNLDHPALAGYETMDLLKDPFYVAENAAITAHCALALIMSRLPVTLTGQPVLVIGWGRIGKCLAELLRRLDAAVTIAARKDSARAMAGALGYETADPANLEGLLPQLRVIVNTAPASVLSDHESAMCSPDCLKLELASRLGIGGSGVIWARGLPGKDAPETSGRLIAETVIRLIQGKEQAP